MTQTSKTLIFFGNEQLASGVDCDAPIFRSLIEAGYKIDFLVLSQKPTSGRKSKQPKIIDLANRHNIPIKYVEKLSDLSDEIKSSDSSFAVLAAFGRIVPQATIDLFEHGIINIHPSLLPEFRGSSPIEAAILSGQQTTGVSLMSLSAGMDEGPVFGFAEVEVAPGMPKQSLYEELSSAGSAMLIELLPKIIDGTLAPMQQDHDKATFTQRLTKTDGEIDWNKPAQQIEREVRAYLGWPGSQTHLAGKEVTITNVNVLEESGTPGTIFTISKSRFGVYCGEQALEILKLKPAGKSEMTAAGFMAGNKLN
jgi:methionyl-tRNA formyltransferase